MIVDLTKYNNKQIAWFMIGCVIILSVIVFGIYYCGFTSGIEASYDVISQSYENMHCVPKVNEAIRWSI